MTGLTMMGSRSFPTSVSQVSPARSMVVVSSVGSSIRSTLASVTVAHPVKRIAMVNREAIRVFIAIVFIELSVEQLLHSIGLVDYHSPSVMTGLTIITSISSPVFWSQVSPARSMVVVSSAGSSIRSTLASVTVAHPVKRIAMVTREAIRVFIAMVFLELSVEKWLESIGLVDYHSPSVMTGLTIITSISSPVFWSQVSPARSMVVVSSAGSSIRSTLASVTVAHPVKRIAMVNREAIRVFIAIVFIELSVEQLLESIGLVDYHSPSVMTGLTIITSISSPVFWSQVSPARSMVVVSSAGSSIRSTLASVTV